MPPRGALQYRYFTRRLTSLSREPVVQANQQSELAVPAILGQGLTSTAIPRYNVVCLTLIRYYAEITFQLFLSRALFLPAVALFPPY
jgi:hypothetical protein